MSDLIINTREAPGEFDALIKLRPKEPYFPLVGRDKFAPPLVMEWARQNRERSLDEFDRGLIDQETRDRELRKSTQAEEIAWGMQAYKKGHAPVETREDRYSGYVDTEEQKAADAIRRQRLDAVQALHNAIGEANDLAEMLIPGDEERRAIVNTIKAMRALADLIQPKRPGLDSKKGRRGGQR